MPTKKVINDKYTIKAPIVVIEGDLQVGGTQTSLTVQNTSVQDNTIVLNSGEQGAGVTSGTGTSGIQIDRGTESDVGLRWNEDPRNDGSGGAWQVTYDGVNWKYLVSSDAGETQSTIDGDLNLNGYTIVNELTGTSLALLDPNRGASGLYVSNSMGTDQELITKRRSQIFSIILR